MSIVQYIRNKFNTRQRRLIRRIFVDITYPIIRYNLNLLAQFCGTDKSGFHNYTQLYDLHFNNLRKEKIKLLEIGVGGYNDSEYGGNSLRMWKKYFRRGRIYGIDIHDKSRLEEKRIKIYKGNQKDKEFLLNIISEIGELDIVIDDGSHINKDIVKSFKTIFPKLKDGGIYVVEDTQTSYIDSYGGDSSNLDNPNTTMNFFKNFIDYVNDKEYDKKIISDLQSYFDINSIHFYHNIIFIYKS